ncbi:MAG: transglutaminase domain-containing protein [Spirochaetia bacterium]|nr:transglutaminase domain-containing protein [Spirochaetia bacterium]
MYLQPTKLLDYKDLRIQRLILSKGWNTLISDSAKIEAVYNYVRDRILFGYSPTFDLKASEVLSLGYGHCLTKTTLLMALLRALGIPCRLRAGTISRVIFRGLLPAIEYRLMDKTVHHSYVELYFDNRWIATAGHIIDRSYLSKLQAKFPDHMGTFLGYGIAVIHFRNPPINWDEDETSIQSKALHHDLGAFNDPDSFFKTYPKSITDNQRFVFQKFILPSLNEAIIDLRNNQHP